MFSVLTVFIAFGAVTGTSEGIMASQRRARREEHRSRKNNLIVHCPKSSAFAAQLEGRSVVLSGGRLFVDTSDSPDPNAPFGHPFAGYFLPYPEARHAGLVSTITDEAPIMNWVFAERESYALCYGPRAASEGNFTGPWDCTRQDRRLTFGGWEGFMAVRIPPAEDGSGGGFWALFFDRDGDQMKSKLADWPAGTVAVEVTLARRELRTLRPQLTAEQLAELQRRMEASKAEAEAEAEKRKAQQEAIGPSEQKEQKEQEEHRAREEREQEEQRQLEVGRAERERKEQEQKEREFREQEEREKMDREKKKKEREEKEQREKIERREKREQRERQQKTRMEKQREQMKQDGKDTQQKQHDSSRSSSRNSRNSAADGEADDEDEFSSSVYSGYSSWRASSSAMSVPDSESSEAN